MILYASSPDGIASQQFNYDQFRLGANQNNAARFDAAQARALSAALQQREQDQARQDAADSVGIKLGLNLQDQNFTAEQNRLNRTSAERNVNTQYSSTHTDRQDALAARDFDTAQKLATSGQLEQDPEKLKLLYPHFDTNQIKILADASSQHGLSRFQNALDQSLRNGSPLPVEAVKNYVSPSSTAYQDALDHRIAALAGPQKIYDASVEKSRKGNLSESISSRLAGLNTNPNSTEGVNWLPSKDQSAWQNFSSIGGMLTGQINRPLMKAAAGVVNYFSPPEQIQPAGDWQGRARDVTNSLRSGNDQSVVIDASTGQLVPNMQNPNGPTTIPIVSSMAPSSAIQPIPSDKSQLVAGVAYQTPNGVLKWTGTGFIRP